MAELEKYKYADETEFEKEEAEELEREEEIVESVTEDRKLTTDSTTPDVETVLNRIERKDIIVHPEYQRNYVWTVPQASKFIESLFINIPVAPVFTNENEDGTQEVIDGQQRLTTINNFHKGELNLKGLRYFSGLNGKTFDRLSKAEQRTFLSKSLSFIRVNKESSEDIKFDVFTRINQGGTPLTNQELRRVMYRGKYIDFLDLIVNEDEEKYKAFNEIFSGKQYLTRNLGNQEIALRLISISKLIEPNLAISSKYSGDLQRLYTSYLEENRNNAQEIKRSDSEFVEAINVLNKIFPNPSERFASFVVGKDVFSPRINKAVAEFEYILSREIHDRKLSQIDYAKVRKLVKSILGENEQDCFGRRAPNKNMLSLRLTKVIEILTKLEEKEDKDE
ncbi:MAG: DUF262 domain-containing protein [Streptococcaceae bacterium]|jgi:hypothetical protein|nr:DUF262 domain-containing protein [Streptococcaceae bacterium]